jgi:hypothetical protein
MTSKKINCQLYVVKAAEDYTEHGIMQGDIFIVDDSQTDKRLMAYLADNRTVGIIERHKATDEHLLIGGVVEVIKSLVGAAPGGSRL